VKSFRPHLIGHLTGISDSLLDDHVGLYERFCRELEGITQAYPRVSWTRPAEAAGLLPGTVQALMDTRIAALPLSLEGNRLGAVLEALRAETTSRGISFWPRFYLGTDDFWTTDRAISVNIPWYLGSDSVWQVVCQRELAWTDDDVLRVLRHEYAHALLYAFEGWKEPIWTRAFGDFDQAYQDAYDPDPSRAGNFVVNLGRPGQGALLHYAQKHPDEDWAETFAVWLRGGWETEYAPGSGALAKLGAVTDLVAQGTFYGSPKVRAPGRIEPFTTIAGTVGDYVGVGERAFSVHSALLRREPEVLAQVLLHESYFGALRRSTAPGPEFTRRATQAFGSWESWALDMRAIGGSTGGWGLVVWDRGSQRIRNALVAPSGAGVPPGCDLLLAVCCQEHAYEADYGSAGKHLYLGAVFRNLDWQEIERRLLVALAPAHAPGHVLGGLVPKGGSCCSKCRFLVSAVGLPQCSNEYFQRWNGSAQIPGPTDAYCCDEFPVG
jgi:hypothetical protein